MSGRRIGELLLLTTACFVLALFTTFQHTDALGMEYLDLGPQFQRHRAIFEGNACDPWQYRVLTAWLVEPLLRGLAMLHIPRFVVLGFVVSRLLLDAALFLVALAYYRKLGLSTIHSVIGLCLLAWGVSYSSYDSDLQFNTYLDVTFYLLAGLCVLSDRPLWIVPLTLFAALNRETSGLIPLLPVVAGLHASSRPRLTWICSGVALAVYAAVFFGLRAAYGPQAPIDAHGHMPGWGLLEYNFTRVITLRNLLSTLSIIPIVALIGARTWPKTLQRMGWAVVPAWFAIHAVAAAMVETRVLLVPHALVFIPGALLFAQASSSKDGLEVGRAGDAVEP